MSSPNVAATVASTRCPCGSASYAECCARLHRGEVEAATAGQVMRARYSAFACHNEAYLLRTWHPDTRPKHVRFESGLRWLGLDVIATTGGNLLDTEGVVEFQANYERDNTPGVLHERSRFLRAKGRWVYVVG